MPQEVPEIHLDLAPMVLKGTQIHILALRFGLVGGCARHSRREVFDCEDIVMRLEDLREQCRQVEPLPGCSFEGAVVQIGNRLHRHTCASVLAQEKARASEEAPRPAVETARGIITNLDA